MQKSPADGPGGGQASGKITICIYHKIPAGGGGEGILSPFGRSWGSPAEAVEKVKGKSSENFAEISLFFCGSGRKFQNFPFREFDIKNEIIISTRSYSHFPQGFPQG